MRENGPSRLLGLRVDRLTTDAFVHQVVEKTLRGERGYCCITNVHSCITARDCDQLRDAIDKATVAIPDSTILQWAYALRFGEKPISATHGADIMMQLCDLAATASIPIGFYGGKDDTLLKNLRHHIKAACPGSKIAFAYAPPFRALTQTETDCIIEDINRSGVRLLFVGIGCPKQELWMAQNTKHINAMMIGVGAAFDVNAGLVCPSPNWVHKFGLEWLFRLAKEPKRLSKRYISTGPRFLYLLLTDWISAAFSQRNRATNK